MTEPWLRGTLTDVDPVLRSVMHALEQAGEDIAAWTEGLSDEEAWARPLGLAPVAFQLKHVAGSLDRLLTYARGGQLTDGQMAELKAEMTPDGGIVQARDLALRRLIEARAYVAVVPVAALSEPRGVGRKALPTTVAGLLVHCADHTQRHIGQMIVTVRVLRAVRQ